MNFTSDNAAGVHPAILDSVKRAAPGMAPSYGNDQLTIDVEAQIRKTFEAPEARAYLVATGTAANSLSLACLCPPWSAVYTHSVSHVEEDETGAPEFFTGGAKLTLIGGPNAKIDPEALKTKLANAVPRGVHNVQKGALSLSQVTELGAVYTPGEVKRLCDIAHEEEVPVQMDGARFANALARLGCTPAEASWKAGVDILCLGATKNGAMAAEAVIIFDPAKAWEFELRRKRGGHLFSKMRFVAAQIQAYLADGLWLKMASHANAMAARLAEGLRAVPDIAITSPVESNMVFADIPMGLHRRITEAGARYFPSIKPPSAESPEETPFPARLVCSFQTTEDEIDRFVTLARG